MYIKKKVSFLKNKLLFSSFHNLFTLLLRRLPPPILFVLLAKFSYDSSKEEFVNIQPITLEGKYVRLEPLTLGHLAPLCEVGLDPELWQLIPTPVNTRDDMKAYIEAALKLQAEGTALPFATVEKSSNKVVGSTRFANIDKANRRLEIGWTWIARPWQRTIINTEAKYLMLRHAFEALGCIRVELKTDALNAKSRAAMLRIGAKEEGIFRNHMITQSGRIRDSVYFSIIEKEWPTVKISLEEKLARPFVPKGWLCHKNGLKMQR